MDEHIRSIHKDVVKKTFSKEAFEMVTKSEDYTEWLKKTSSKKNEGKKQVTVSQMQKTNKIQSVGNFRTIPQYNIKEKTVR